MDPFSELIEAYRHSFMVRATLVALVVAVTCSVISFFVVMRRMAFVGAGISHIAFGGVALALLLNRGIKGRSVFRALLILPWAMPQYITALTWRGMFNLEYGQINLLLGSQLIEEKSYQDYD